MTSPFIRDDRGRFAPGSPGRLPGTRNRVSAQALRDVKSMADIAVAELRRRLAEHDWQAVLFVLDRALPKGRSVELDGVTPSDIASHLINGDITTAEAKDIAIALSKLAEIGEIAEIRAKIEALERMLSDVHSTTLGRD